MTDRPLLQGPARLAVTALALTAAAAICSAKTPPGGAAMRIACGLNGISDWTPCLPFVDVARSSRGWVQIDADKPIDYPHGDPERTLTIPVDENGYPRQIPAKGKRVTTVLLVGVPAAAYPKGKFTLLFDGTGTIHLGWTRAITPSAAAARTRGSTSSRHSPATAARACS